MALKASGLAGTAKLHDLTSSSNLLCDLCGEEVDSEVADAVALDCSFAQCDPVSSCYHAHCLEKFLKSIRCERNRKIGFPCPRGCGKGTKFKEACRGKILKSHPVTIRSEANKKRRQAELDQLAQQAAKDKDRAKKKEEEAKAAASSKAAAAVALGAAGSSKDKEKGKGKQVAGAPKAAVSIKALNVANTTITSTPPPKSQAQLQKEQLAAAAKNLKSQILRQSSTGSVTSTSAAGSSAASKLAAGSGGGSGRLSAAGSVGGGSGKREVKTLDEYLAERTGAASGGLERSSSMASSAAAAPLPSAWGRSRASSASSLEAAEMQEVAAAAAAAAAAVATPALVSDDAFPPPAAAAAVTAGRPPRPPPAPAPPPPAPVPAPAPAAVQPQGVWAQKPAVAVVAAVPPPPPPRAPAAPASAPAAAAPSQAAKGKSTTAAAAGAAAPMAAAAAAPAAEDTKLSRTQRKNQKRAEKKAAAAAAAEAAAAAAAAAEAGPGSASPPDSLPGSPQQQQQQQQPSHIAGPVPAAPAASTAGAASPGPPGFHGDAASCRLHDGSPSEGLAALGYSESFERCVQALVQHKLQHQVEQLQQLGFAPSAALAAVQQHGGSLEGALVALLEQATGVRSDGMHSLGLAASSAPSEVDLTEELQHMQDLATRYGLPPGTVEMLAVEHQGDLDSLAASLSQQQQAMLAYSGGGVQQQQQQHQGAMQRAQAAAAATQQGQQTTPEPLSPGGIGSGGLFGSLGAAVGSEPSYSLESWGHSASVDTASSAGGGGGLGGGAGCYSAFGFGGFAEAALHAVHGGGLAAQTSVLGSSSTDGMGTPTSRDQPVSALGGAAGIWGSSTSPHGGSCLAAAAGGGYSGSSSSDAHLRAMLGAPSAGAAAPGGGSGSSSSGFGLLGSFDALQPSSMQSIFEQHPAGTAAPTLLPFPGGSLHGQQQQLHQHQHQLLPSSAAGGSSGWRSSEGLPPGVQPHHQQPFSGLPLWGAGGSGLSGLAQAGGGLPQERDLNDLMTTLLVR